MTAAAEPVAIARVLLWTTFVDNLKLGEFGETFLGEFGPDAGLLSAAEWDVRRHVEMLVDPHRSSLDAARDLMRPRGIGRPYRGAETIIGRVRPAVTSSLSEYLMTGRTGPNCSSSTSLDPSLISRTMVGSMK